MREFVFLKPFPACVKTLDRSSSGLGVRFPLGPFNLREAMRIFWKLKDVNFVYAWNVYIADIRYGRESVVCRSEGRVTLDRALKGETIQHSFEPFERCAERNYLIYLNSSTNSYPTFRIDKPCYLEEYAKGVPLEDREYYFPLYFMTSCFNIGDSVYNVVNVNATEKIYDGSEEYSYFRTIKVIELELFGKTLPLNFYTHRDYFDGDYKFTWNFDAECGYELHG